MDGNHRPHHEVSQQAARAGALGIWLEGFVWEAWATFTFGGTRYDRVLQKEVPKWGPDGPSLDRAEYHFSRWVNGQPDRPGFFYAVERGSASGRSHVHALIAPTGSNLLQPKRSSRWRSWHRRFGRAEILPYGFDRSGRVVSGAEWYLTKYLTKAPLRWKVGGRIITG